MHSYWCLHLSSFAHDTTHFCWFTPMIYSKVPLHYHTNRGKSEKTLPICVLTRKCTRKFTVSCRVYFHYPRGHTIGKHHIRKWKGPLSFFNCVLMKRPIWNNLSENSISTYIYLFLAHYFMRFSNSSMYPHVNWSPFSLNTITLSFFIPDVLHLSPYIQPAAWSFVLSPATASRVKKSPVYN